MAECYWDDDFDVKEENLNQSELCKAVVKNSRNPIEDHLTKESPDDNKPEQNELGTILDSYSYIAGHWDLSDLSDDNAKHQTFIEQADSNDRKSDPVDKEPRNTIEDRTCDQNVMPESFRPVGYSTDTTECCGNKNAAQVETGEAESLLNSNIKIECSELVEIDSEEAECELSETGLSEDNLKEFVACDMSLSHTVLPKPQVCPVSLFKAPRDQRKTCRGTRKPKVTSSNLSSIPGSKLQQQKSPCKRKRTKSVLGQLHIISDSSDVGVSKMKKRQSLIKPRQKATPDKVNGSVCSLKTQRVRKCYRQSKKLKEKRKYVDKSQVHISMENVEFQSSLSRMVKDFTIGSGRQMESARSDDFSKWFPGTQCEVVVDKVENTVNSILQEYHGLKVDLYPLTCRAELVNDAESVAVKNEAYYDMDISIYDGKIQTDTGAQKNLSEKRANLNYSSFIHSASKKKLAFPKRCQQEELRRNCKELSKENQRDSLTDKQIKSDGDGTVFNMKKCRRGRPKKTEKPAGGNNSEKDNTEKVFKCGYCEFTSYRKSFASKHRLKKHSILTCKYCNKKFRFKNRLLQHMSQKHRGLTYFQCLKEGCTFISKYKKDVIKHERIHADEKPFSCNLCDFNTKWHSNLKHHGELKHVEIRPFKCKSCEFSFKRKQDLKEHIDRQNLEKKFACPVCGFKVKTNWELKSHCLTHTNYKPFRCTFPGCTMAKKCQGELNKHMVIHKTERDILCEICARAYKSFAALRKHVQVMHTPHVPVACDTCGKVMKSKYSLKNHMAKHVREAPFSCDVCGKKFFLRMNLRNHMVTHSTVGRPYLCPLCPHAAKTFHNLLAHIGTAHGKEYAFFCELCRKPFTQFFRLNQHYERMHTQEELRKMKEKATKDLALLKMDTKLNAENIELMEESRKAKIKKGSNKIANDVVDIKEEPIDDENDVRNGDSLNIDLLNNVVESVTINTSELFENICCEGDLSYKNDVNQVLEKNQINVFVEEDSTSVSNKVDGIVWSASSACETLGSNMVNEDRVDNEGVNTLLDLSTENISQEETVPNSVENIDLMLNDKRVATLGYYDSVHLPLATKGFQFNYDKSGSKPNSWFMDPDLMNGKDRLKQELHLRRKGILPPLPRGHPTRGSKNRVKKTDETSKKRAAGLSVVNNDTAKRNIVRSARFRGTYADIEDYNLELEVEESEQRQDCSEVKLESIEQPKIESVDMSNSSCEVKKEVDSIAMEEMSNAKSSKKLVKQKVKRAYKKSSEGKGLKNARKSSVTSTVKCKRKSKKKDANVNSGEFTLKLSKKKISNVKKETVKKGNVKPRARITTQPNKETEKGTIVDRQNVEKPVKKRLNNDKGHYMESDSVLTCGQKRKAELTQGPKYKYVPVKKARKMLDNEN